MRSIIAVIAVLACCGCGVSATQDIRHPQKSFEGETDVSAFSVDRKSESRETKSDYQICTQELSGEPDQDTYEECKPYVAGAKPPNRPEQPIRTFNGYFGY
jgi:hypothetical protein